MENALAWDSNSGGNVNMSNKAKVTISRRSDDKIWITIYDCSSRSDFVEVQLELADFALAISGLSKVEGNLFVRKLENVGKKKIAQKRQKTLPDHIRTKEAIADWMIENCLEKGWMTDTYLGAQDSVVYNPNNMTRVVNYSIFRYEDAEGPE